MSLSPLIGMNLSYIISSTISVFLPLLLFKSDLEAVCKDSLDPPKEGLDRICTVFAQ